MVTATTQPPTDPATKSGEGWTILVYRVPPHPTRLRLSIWRRLNAMGALYLQDGVCLVPARADLTENLLYVAQAVQEMEGTCHVFASAVLLPDSAETLATGFRALADQRLVEIAARLDGVLTELGDLMGKMELPPAALVRAENELKRERVAYLRARRLAYCGSSLERETEVDGKLDRLRKMLDGLGRGNPHNNPTAEGK